MPVSAPGGRDAQRVYEGQVVEFLQQLLAACRSNRNRKIPRNETREAVGNGARSNAVSLSGAQGGCGDSRILCEQLGPRCATCGAKATNQLRDTCRLQFRLHDAPHRLDLLLFSLPLPSDSPPLPFFGSSLLAGRPEPATLPLAVTTSASTGSLPHMRARKRLFILSMRLRSAAWVVKYFKHCKAGECDQSETRRECRARDACHAQDQAGEGRGSAPHDH